MSCLLPGSEHHLCAEDWVTFSATAGKTYLIETFDLAPGTHTRLRLYTNDGSWAGTSRDVTDHDDTMPANLITVPSKSGAYYVEEFNEFNGSPDVWL